MPMCRLPPVPTWALCIPRDRASPYEVKGRRAPQLGSSCRTSRYIREQRNVEMGTQALRNTNRKQINRYNNLNCLLRYN